MSKILIDISPMEKWTERQYICYFVALLLLGGCSRPYYIGDVSVSGIKGVNHLISYSDIGWPDTVVLEKIRYAKEAGVTISRGPHFWSGCDLESWNRRLYLIRLLQQHGIESVPIVHFYTTIDDLASWRKFCRTRVTNIPVQRISLGGEFYISPPEEYARYLNVFSEELRRVRSDIVIHAPSLNSRHGYDIKSFLRALNVDDFNVLTIQPYEAGWDYVNRAMELVPDKPVWIEADGQEITFEFGGVSSDVACAMRGSYKEYLSHPRIDAVLWNGLCDYGMPRYNLLDYRLEDGLPVFSATSRYEVFKSINNGGKK